ncbi:MAG TPA: aminoacyl-tRNA hydrolase [Thermodesulfobacteriota bacterium]|nr:aminoacyl-tRNA hydrolase [Thermodesulfobacteriota bacterium]
MFVILGLGNPGQSYGKTRHNAGFMAIDLLASESGVKIDRQGDGYVCGVCRVGEEEVALAKPLTYMNLSGGAAERLLRLYGGSPASLIVVYDDCDLELGRLRIGKGGGSGGHRGVASIMERLGTPDFLRLRLGIGRPPSGTELSDYVLLPFGPEEKEVFEDELKRAAAALTDIIKNGADFAMNLHNARQ